MTEVVAVPAATPANDSRYGRLLLDLDELHVRGRRVLDRAGALEGDEEGGDGRE